jgi:hypothetical protein
MVIMSSHSVMGAIMLQSHIIEIDGAFVGAAVRLDIGFRFVATDIRVEELDGTVWPSLPDLRRLAGGLYRTGRLSLPVRPVLRNVVPGPHGAAV